MRVEISLIARCSCATDIERMSAGIFTTGQGRQYPGDTPKAVDLSGDFAGTEDRSRVAGAPCFLLRTPDLRYHGRLQVSEKGPGLRITAQVSTAKVDIWMTVNTRSGEFSR
jgi:hypothetical protein